MQIASCEHPVRIRNKRTNLYEYVPCGKCNTCRNRKASAWVSRLNDEASCWPYVWFVTLTYDEQNVPFMLYDAAHEQLCDPSTGSFVQITDNKEHVYLCKHPKFRHLSVSDCQLFFKRLRYYCDFIGFQTKEYVKIRYYLVGEYGPTTIRPHYHLLLFFKSPTLHSQMESLLSKSWSLGLVDSSIVRSNASSYVAQYLNCNSHLPSVCLRKEFRPFHLCSKCPPIGSLLYSEKEIFKIFSLASPTMRHRRGMSNEYVDVPLLPFIKNKLFPKIVGFSEFSHYDRVTLYGLAKISACEDFDSFKDWYFGQVDKFWFTDSAGQPVLRLPHMLELLDQYIVKSVFDSNGLRVTDRLSKLRSLFRVSRRVCLQAAVFDCTIDFYVSQIERFYNNVDKLNLVTQYEFEDDYVRHNGDVRSLIFLDPLYVKRLVESYEKFLSPLPSVVLDYLKTFGLDERFIFDEDYRDSLSLANNRQFREMVNKSKYIVLKSTKTKKKNEYLKLHPESLYK